MFNVELESLITFNIHHSTLSIQDARMLRDKYQSEIESILSRYPVKRSALIPLLYLAQQDEGFVSESAMKEIAGLLRLTPPQVYETATFYTMLNLKRVGTFHL